MCVCHCRGVAIYAIFTGGEDFTPVLMNVTFVPGETMKTVTVDIIPDVIIEENERFYLQLEGIEGEPNTISLPDGAWATIIDDGKIHAHVAS